MLPTQPKILLKPARSRIRGSFSLLRDLRTESVNINIKKDL